MAFIVALMLILRINTKIEADDGGSSTDDDTNSRTASRWW